MPADTPDCPDHRRLLAYFRDFADHVGLRGRFRFGTEVARAQPLGADPDSGWRLTVRAVGGAVGGGQGDDDEVGGGTVVDAGEFSAPVIAHATLCQPSIPEFAGRFRGEVRHTSGYRYPQELAGKGRLSGCPRSCSFTPTPTTRPPRPRG